jgi:hypothetical protein
LTPNGCPFLTLPRPGEQRKDSCPAALAQLGFKVSWSLPIPVERRDFPVPIPGLMEPSLAVARRPFPVPRVGQMEFI